MRTQTGLCVASAVGSHVDYHADDLTLAYADVGAVLDAIREAEQLFGRHSEACGYFREHDEFGVLVDVVGLENVNASTSGTFALHDDDCLLLAELLDQRVLLGMWHSHPNGHREPSMEDWAGHPWGVPMYIVSCEGEDTYIIMRYTDDDRPGKRCVCGRPVRRLNAEQWVHDDDDSDVHE